jgi:cyanophycinase-like exopeptidase
MSVKGAIVLVGSGELTASMVEVYKEMLGRRGPNARAAFLDTPAGFQLNADQISAKALDYFRDKVGQSITVTSFKSSASAAAIESEKAFLALKQADFVLVGPGSPTYAVRQWSSSPIPDILAHRIEEGACFVAASAAALTAGRFTLPVYEIYKVGEEPHWVKGIDILGRFGFKLVVVPHWNNAEGGTHDTRFCFMGEPRFRLLEGMLPEDVHVLGIDEHTACVIDLARDEAYIRGVGAVTLRNAGSELVLRKNDIVPLGVLRGKTVGPLEKKQLKHVDTRTKAEPPDSFWKEISSFESTFRAAQDARDPEQMAAAVLELERVIWRSSRDPERMEFISHAREILRELVVQMGTMLSSASRTTPDYLGPLVEEILKLRGELRRQKRWIEADQLRDCLQRAQVMVEDASNGVRWRIGGQE